MRFRLIKFLIIFSYLITLNSCLLIEVKTVEFKLNFSFGYSFNTETKKDNALLLYQYNFLDDYLSSKISSDKYLLAGDKLTLKYIGDLYIQESFPGKIILKGNLISYSFSYANVISLSKNDFIYNQKNELIAFKNYELNTEFIINDNELLTYISLNEYNKDSLYASISEENIIVGLYFNKPR